MADKSIYVTAPILREKASNLRSYISEHDEAINKIRNLVNGLPSEFKGVAADTYIEKFNSMEPTFNNFSEMLEELASKLDYAAEQFSAADDAVAGKMG